MRWLAFALLLAPLSVHADPVLAPVDKLKSSIVAVAKSPGFLGLIGNQPHALLAFRWFAALRLDRKKISASNLEVAVASDALEIDTPDAFRAAGLGAAPSEEKANQARTAILGQQGLDAARFPMIRFSGESVAEKGAGQLLIRGKLTIRGVTRDLEIPVTMKPAENETLRFQATLPVRLVDFEIPLAKAGPFRLKNEAEIRLDFTTEPETVVAKASLSSSLALFSRDKVDVLVIPGANMSPGGF